MADKAAGGVEAEKRSPAHQPGEVLHQRRSLPLRPIKMAMGGVAAAAVIGYFVLFSKKKPEATATDLARVITGTATPDHTRPRK
ncbi:hypothetical protein Nepgr_024656 [Nepenthes gracilis]|uniref:Uncharacterized protein n=1 Tax=Nepenthes gracilis TaxID=150966 RepID=A0AAD3XZ04_NEPGR|nr:hypothetical protein Nepgr_024656 [Nepenthes gracilis]